MIANQTAIGRGTRHYPNSFVQAVVSHAMETRASACNPQVHPGALMIQGPAGAGKSSGIRYIAEQLEASFREIHAKDMAAPYEGEAIIPLQEAYVASANDDSSELKFLNLDDLDMGDARVDEKYTGTNNSHHFSAFLMRLTDDPFHLRIEEDAGPGKAKPEAVEHKLKNPPAIFMTVNNSGALHSPLIREGRARMVTLDPRGRDLELAVAGMYPALTERQARKLVRRYSSKSVAFFAELGRTASRGIALQRAKACGYRFSDFNWDEFSQELSKASSGASFEALLSAARHLAAADRGTNFLSTEYVASRKKTWFPGFPGLPAPMIPRLNREA